MATETVEPKNTNWHLRNNNVCQVFGQIDWSRYDMVLISRQHFQIHFPLWILLYFVSNFTETCFQCSHKNGYICCHKGLVPNRRQAIIWIDDDLLWTMNKTSPTLFRMGYLIDDEFHVVYGEWTNRKVFHHVCEKQTVENNLYRCTLSTYTVCSKTDHNMHRSGCVATRWWDEHAACICSGLYLLPALNLMICKYDPSIGTNYTLNHMCGSIFVLYYHYEGT